ncbi:MAG: Cold shock protein ScoF [Verrucomicrobia subdivision 3 bacterium]|nr:Cold shock protein ScoF [Limisphaerales bacterium]
MNNKDQKFLRIAVFYDGNFFFHVSNYYRYSHPRKQRISIPGLHKFIRHHVAEVERADANYCHIVDAHFFRGRISARKADERQKLYAERVFDDILMGEGVVTHYLPVRRGAEKGIDVWLALEALELAIYKRFDVLVIICGDSDLIPLARKVNSLGTRIMLLGWDFKYTDESHREHETVTSIHLLNEVTYPTLMHQIIDDKTNRKDPLIANLFVPDKDPGKATSEPAAPATPDEMEPQDPAVEATDIIGEILSVYEGYGFIKCDAYPSNVFYHHSAVDEGDFDDFRKGDHVVFDIYKGEKGPQAARLRKDPLV